MFSPAAHTRLIFVRRLCGIDVSPDVYIMAVGSQISPSKQLARGMIYDFDPTTSPKKSGKTRTNHKHAADGVRGGT
jgi:hypothetical protein